MSNPYHLTRFQKYVQKKVGSAIAQFNLIEDGDRILVAVSGGKDSLTMLHVLSTRRRKVPIGYELVAAHVITDRRCPGCLHRRTLEKVFQELDVPYVFLKTKIILEPGEPLSCHRCSWARRKALFEACDALKMTKVALGHHKDDIVHTTLLNLFYHGEFSTMVPRLPLFEGTLDLIRPLSLLDEESCRRYAEECGYPSQLCKCPASLVNRRNLMREVMDLVGKENTGVKSNIFKAMGRVRPEYLPWTVPEGGSKPRKGKPREGPDMGNVEMELHLEAGQGARGKALMEGGEG